MEVRVIDKVKNVIEETTTCFICKDQIQKSMICPQCHKCACASCFQNIQKCPNCKNNFSNKKPERFQIIEGLQEVNNTF